MKWNIRSIVAALVMLLGSRAIAEEIPLTELRAFGTRLEALYNSRDEAGLMALLDAEAYAESALSVIPPGMIKPSTPKLVARLQREGIPFLYRPENKDRKMTFVHARMLMGSQTLLFRLNDNDGISFYLDVYVKQSGNSLQFFDARDCGDDELSSQQCHRTLLRVYFANEGTLPADSQVVKTFKALDDARAVGNYEGALLAIRQLPEKYQQLKFVRIAYVRVIGFVAGRNGILKSLDDFRRDFPDSVACDARALETFEFNKDLEPALKCLDRIERFVVMDPFLDVRRGRLYLNCNQDFAKALAFYEKAASADPDLLEAAEAKLELLIVQRQFPAAVKLLGDIQRNSVWKDDFAAVLARAERSSSFRWSAEFRAWQAAQAK